MTRSFAVGAADPTLDQRLSDELGNFNTAAVPGSSAVELTVSCTDTEGELLGGINGWTSVTIDGYQGVYLELQMPNDIDVGECGQYDVWLSDPSGGRSMQAPGQLDPNWILDVEGDVVVLQVTASPGVPKAPASSSPAWSSRWTSSPGTDRQVANRAGPAGVGTERAVPLLGKSPQISSESRRPSTSGVSTPRADRRQNLLTLGRFDAAPHATRPERRLAQTTAGGAPRPAGRT